MAILDLTKILNLALRARFNILVRSHMANINFGLLSNNSTIYLFILYAIINNVIKDPAAKPIDLQIYDLEKMFDKIKLKEAINDLWDSGVKNDNLVALYELNRNNWT